MEFDQSILYFYNVDKTEINGVVGSYDPDHHVFSFDGALSGAGKKLLECFLHGGESTMWLMQFDTDKMEPFYTKFFHNFSEKREDHPNVENCTAAALTVREVVTGIASSAEEIVQARKEIGSQGHTLG